MKLYLALDLIILSAPLLLSFEPRVCFVKKWKYLFPAIFCTGALFVFWDILAVKRGDWAFNSEYLIGVSAAGLPAEEILFFFCVPYSCIFIYEVLNYYRKDRHLALPSWFFYALAAALAASAVIVRTQGYTSTVLALTSLAVFATQLAYPIILRSVNYWVFILVTFIPFMLVNSTLTSAPVVVYAPRAIWGLRLGTVPIEDFFYSYVILATTFLFYSYARDISLGRERLRKLRQELLTRRSVL